MPAKTNWLLEEEAAKIVGLQPRTLRRLCKSGKLEVNTTNLNGRNFQYSESDLYKTLNRNADYPVRA